MIVNYFVSGVWRNNGNVVSLLMHKNTEEGFTSGVKMSVKEVAQLLKEGITLHAIKWNYDLGIWTSFAPVESIGVHEDDDTLQLKHVYTCSKIENLIDLSKVIDSPSHRPLVNKRIRKQAVNQ